MRATMQAMPGSKIREVANAALGRSDVLAFWFVLRLGMALGL